MKKYLSICIAIVMLLTALKCQYTRNRCKDLAYSVEHNLTSGMFNSHKLYSVKKCSVEFSDGNIAVVKVYGTQKKSPHAKITYNVFAEKSKSGVWNVKKIYDGDKSLTDGEVKGQP